MLRKRGPGRPSISDDELLNTALNLFLEHGFEHTTIDAIAAAARVAKRTVYLRYGDKKSLFKTALRRAIDDWHMPIESLRALESEDLERTLLDVGCALVANVMTPASLRLHKIQNAESGRMPEIGASIYRQGTERLIAYLADLFRRRIGPDTVALSEWDKAAVAFMYLVVCGPPTMTVYGVRLDDAWIEEHTRYCVRLFLYGFRPRGRMLMDMRTQEEPYQESDHTAPSGCEGNIAVSADLQELRSENRRLRELLLKTMLEGAARKEQECRASSDLP